MMEQPQLRRAQKVGPVQASGPDWGPPAARISTLTAGQTPATDRAEGQFPPLPPDVQPPTPPTAPKAGVGAALAIVVGAGLINVALQSRINSLALVLAAVAVAALVLGEQSRRKPTVIAPLVLALVTVGLASIRSSTWVTIPCLVVTIVGMLVASQDRLFPKTDLFTVAGQYLVDVVGTIGWFGNSARRASVGGEQSRNIWRGLLLAVIVIIPIGLLLASADAVFDQLLRQIGSEGLWTHVVLTAIILPSVAAIGLATRRPPGDPRNISTAGRPIAMTEATIVFGAVILLIGVWGVTQVVVALGGADRLLATANLTAAENARQGFFQLVAVAAILIALIVGLDRFTERSGASHDRRFLIMTGLVGVETLGLVMATYSRLSLYINGFGNTMLRTAVAWFLAWLAVAMIVLVVAINTPSFGPRSAGGPLFLLAGLWIVAFAAYNPEAAVANGNLQRGQALVTLDERYLVAGLGSDAIPVLVGELPKLDPDQAVRLSERLCQVPRPETEFGFLGWNRSAAEAASAIDSLNCP